MRTYHEVHKSTNAHLKCNILIQQIVGAFWQHTHTELTVLEGEVDGEDSGVIRLRMMSIGEIIEPADSHEVFIHSGVLSFDLSIESVRAVPLQHDKQPRK